LAAQADPATQVVEAWILFATSVGGLDDAEAALQELVKRVKERPEPFVRYGDFLLASKKDPEGAIAQYRQALIWKSDDEAVKTKVADIYLGMAADHLSRREYASAEVRIREAQKYVSNRTSPQGLKLQELQAEVAQIRGRPPGR
jgi:Tfp pilus assembly protein PilF